MSHAKPVPAAGLDGPNTDGELPALLSRFAGLHGKLVPPHRFVALGRASDQVPAGQSRQDRTLRLWLAQFPNLPLREIPPARLARRQYPALWMSVDGQRMAILRGPRRCEDASGRRVELDPAVRAAGRCWVCGSALRDRGEAGDGASWQPRTARDWFVFSIRRYRVAFIDAGIATFLASGIGLVSALYSMQVYDRVVPTKGYETLFVLTVGVAVAIAVEFLLRYARAHLVDRACKAIDQDLSTLFFAKALGIRMDARPSEIGTFAGQIRNFESVRGFMTASTLFILADVPFALLFIGVIALISVDVALVVLTAVPLALMIGLSFLRPIRRLSALHVEDSNRKSGILVEALDGAETLKACHGEWKLVDRWRELSARTASTDLKLRAISTLASATTQSLQQLAYVGAVAVGAYAITRNNLSMGGLIACSLISGRAFAPLSQMPGLLVQWQHARVAMRGLERLMVLPADGPQDQPAVLPEACAGLLQMSKVAFGYGREHKALEVGALEISPGERVGVIGPVGSGKSTLLKLLSGLYQPAQGAVYLDRIDMAHLAPEFLRDHVAYLPQDIRLFHGTLRENLALGASQPNDGEILRAAAITGLDRVIQSHPRGLELQISEGGRGLSGGQRQLVGLTRLFLLQSRVLLLDEPTASMDGALEEMAMRHLFQELPTDITLVIVTHKLALLQHVTRLLVVEQGGIVADGPRDGVLRQLQAAAPISGRLTGGGQG